MSRSTATIQRQWGPKAQRPARARLPRKPSAGSTPICPNWTSSGYPCTGIPIVDPVLFTRLLPSQDPRRRSLQGPHDLAVGVPIGKSQDQTGSKHVACGEVRDCSRSFNSRRCSSVVAVTDGFRLMSIRRINAKALWLGQLKSQSRRRITPISATKLAEGPLADPSAQ
jgi:hypothetical protein